MPHSIAPWHVLQRPVTRAVLDARGDYVTENVRAHPNQDANTYLIAAAPDLLAALKELLEDPNYQIAIGGNPHAVDAMLARARAAIAKAEGK